MEVEVVTPDEYLGDVMGDIGSRRGKIDGMSQRNEAQVIKAMCLLVVCSVMLLIWVYNSGRGIVPYAISHYSQVPSSVETEIMEKVHGRLFNFKIE